ncbi:Riboflavin synthase [Polaromonas vacuolata]|uniref:Riboflavin synthase n=1 Tax=Polaromonas vacuolata TaxID=37448 RepID=A0A6H2H7R4_9BURK|nr:riboflavin synthase [Polaromonas vacuolata]QJC55833.1 Riboflavin synthase [Polaromonas vacuolata]
MFTGIITGLGRIVAIQSLGSSSTYGKRLTIATPESYLDDVGLGDSIAINGACMTVVSFDQAKGQFDIDISAESLDKTSGLTETGVINLEKAMRANDRLGGHMVSGHVDGIGHVSYFAEIGESWELRILAPSELAKYLAYKGSITVNGVSLTVNQVTDLSAEQSPFGAGCEISINLIPHTVQNTSLQQLAHGSRVNLEIDLIARYVERMLQDTLKSNK